MNGADAIIGVVGTILGIVLSYLAFYRNSKKDSKKAGEEAGTMLSELGYIKANTDEIKTEQKEQRKTNLEVVTRLTAVEASAKQAHKRLDSMETREERLREREER